MRKSFTVILAILCFSLAAFGQAAGLGSITGTVRDASGAPVPSAKVLVSNAALGINRELITTLAGFFAAPALTPNSGYKVTVNKQGFATFEANDLTLQVGGTLDLNVVVKVGAVRTCA